MSNDFNQSLAVTIVSGAGVILVIFSPGRDLFANWTLLLGLIGNFILHGINSFLLYIRSIKDFQGVFFSIKVVNFAFIILSIIGMLGGKFLATWSPFWFFPFGYYVFLAFTIMYALFYDMNQLTQVYQLRVKVHQGTISD